MCQAATVCAMSVSRALLAHVNECGWSEVMHLRGREDRVGRPQVWLKQSIPAPVLPAGPQGTIVKAESTLVADQRPTGAACPVAYALRF